MKRLHPIQHRGVQAQTHLAVIRAREQRVRARTKRVDAVRGSVKSVGSRIGRCSTEAFARRAAMQLPGELRQALEPLLDVVSDLMQRIRAFDRQIEAVVATSYPEAVRLQQPQGVGAQTALAYVLLVEDPKRFAQPRRRRVLRPGAASRREQRLQPATADHQGRDDLGHRLLVSAVRHILGPFGPDCDLRRHGERIAQRGGKNAPERAAVAVARKMAVSQSWQRRTSGTDTNLHGRPHLRL